jgi:hypothetical protein
MSEARSKGVASEEREESMLDITVAVAALQPSIQQSFAPPALTLER